jgi:flagellum-specific ATP synthase
MALLGRVLDSAASPWTVAARYWAPITPACTPSRSTRSARPIDRQLDVGIRAINALLTVGRGQRMGLFAGSGVGKSVLLGMMARYTQADVIVVGLIGERGREVKEFIDTSSAKRACAARWWSPRRPTRAADAPAGRCTPHGWPSTSRPGQDVLLIMDSLTRYAMAQREIALAIGEPPATKGYPPSVFAKLPAGRTGRQRPPGGGSITAFYTVLSEGDDQQDPIADSARAILDGHIVLSRHLAESGHYPAIDIEASISRAMTAIASDAQQRKANQLKQRCRATNATAT